MSYELRPTVAVGPSPTHRGWDDVGILLAGATRGTGVVVVDCYPGVDHVELTSRLRASLDAQPADRARPSDDNGATLLVVDTGSLLLARDALDALLRPYLTDDRVFGYRAPLVMTDVLDAAALRTAAERVEAHRASGGGALVIGPGATLVHRGDLLVYADMPRWEIQQRLRRGAPNWLVDATGEEFLSRYKAGYFVEWRIADRWKVALFDRVDLFLDTTVPGDPRAVAGDAMRAALAEVVERPFRVVPFFDPGLWGGQWMKKRFELPPEAPNYAWGFDCVPEENALLLDFGECTLEVPSINVVLRHPERLLGPRVHSRFGAEFPIRFDFLDTIDGGNLSLQVHPDTGYAQARFAQPYTQDESYYLLEATPDACVYLGFTDGTTKEDLLEAIEEARDTGEALDVSRYVNRYPAARHDHFSIPAGTVHCAGAGCLVLEISATPYIYTFKLWDWGRTGMDGRPRPIHAERGRAVLRDDRDAAWAAAEVIGRVETVGDADGVLEERTGLHPLEFIETRRHWFEGPVAHRTEGSVHVLNLVQGEGIVVESPDEAFAPFRAGFAETFIVPASVAEYTVRPERAGSRHATVRASVRC